MRFTIHVIVSHETPHCWGLDKLEINPVQIRTQVGEATIPCVIGGAPIEFIAMSDRPRSAWGSSGLGGRSDVTSRELLGVIIRRWYILLLGALVSVAALQVMTHRPGVYWTHFDVVILAPTYEYYPNKLEDPHYALSPIAGVLVRDWNRTNPPLLTASGDTTMFGEGRREGIQVRMPNEGSQWRPLYTSPNIDVQILGSNPAAVEAEAQRVYAELDRMLQQRQDALGVTKTVRMTSIMSPADPSVAYIAGSRARAAAATGLAGAAMTVTFIYWLEQFLIRRRRSISASDEHHVLSGVPV